MIDNMKFGIDEHHYSSGKVKDRERIKNGKPNFDKIKKM